MKTIDRAFISIGIVAALALGLHWRSGAGTAAAQGGSVPAPVRIATADVLGLTQRMLYSERYRPMLEAYQKAKESSLDGLRQDLQRIQTEGTALPENDPRRMELARTFEAKRNEFEQARLRAVADYEQFATEKAQEAYRVAIGAAEELATKMGYTHVFASRGAKSSFNVNNTNLAMQEVLARPLIMSPAGDDLTETLIKELKLENVPMPSAAAPTPAPQAQPVAP